jgi:hypothetical protein
MASIAQIGKPLEIPTPPICDIILARIEIYNILKPHTEHMPDKELKSAVSRLVDLFIKE